MLSKAHLNEGTPAQQALVLQSRWLASQTRSASDALFTKYYEFLQKRLVGFLRGQFKFDDERLKDIFQDFIIDHVKSLQLLERIEKILACLPLVNAPLEERFFANRISEWCTVVKGGMEKAKSRPAEWIRLSGAEIEVQVSKYNARSRELRFSGGHVLERGLAQFDLALPSSKSNTSEELDEIDEDIELLPRETQEFVARLKAYDGRFKKIVHADIRPASNHELTAFAEKWPELNARNNLLLNDFARVMGTLLYLLNRVQIQQLAYLYKAVKSKAITAIRGAANTTPIHDLMASEDDDQPENSKIESLYADPSKANDHGSTWYAERAQSLDPAHDFAARQALALMENEMTSPIEKAQQEFTRGINEIDREKWRKEIEKHQRRNAVYEIVLEGFVEFPKNGYSQEVIAERLGLTRDMVRTDISHINAALQRVRGRLFPPEI